MIRQEIKKCIEWGHEYLFYLNSQEPFVVQVRNKETHKKIIRKLKSKAKNMLHENSPKGVIVCIDCNTYLKYGVLKYLDYVSNNLDNNTVRLDFEQFIHNITLTRDHQHLKIRTKYRGGN